MAATPAHVVQGRRGTPAALFVVLTGCLLALLAASLLVKLYQPWLFRKLWVGVLLVQWTVWAVTAVAAVGSLLALALNRHWALLAVTLAACLATLVAIDQDEWSDWFADVHYQLHRTDFAGIRVAVGGGRLGEPGDWDLYGRPLPPDLAGASAMGTVASIRPFDGGATDPVLLVPMDAFVPDGGWGYAYLGAQPDRSVVYDVFGDGATPHQHVGDGWWVVG